MAVMLAALIPGLANSSAEVIFDESNGIDFRATFM
jgi:hypothetical protein